MRAVTQGRSEAAGRADATALGEGELEALGGGETAAAPVADGGAAPDAGSGATLASGAAATGPSRRALDSQAESNATKRTKVTCTTARAYSVLRRAHQLTSHTTSSAPPCPGKGEPI